jgi:hypothetical protein
MSLSTEFMGATPMAGQRERMNQLIDQEIAKLREQLSPILDQAPVSTADDQAWHDHMEEHTAIVREIAARKRAARCSMQQT